MERSKQSRNFLLTLNNPNTNVQEWLEKLFLETKAVYVCGQLEKGTEGTEHIQAFVNFASGTRYSKIHKYDKRIAITTVNRNNGADDYCLKKETRIEGPWEFGTKPVRRNCKTDWEEVWSNAKVGRFNDIPADIRIRNYGNLQRIAKDNLVLKQNEDLRGIWIMGPAGCGKSSLARAKYPNYYRKNRNDWWDGYANEEAVIMDDISPFDRQLGGKLKDWTDRYGCILQTKGGAIVDNYKVFIITSQYSIDEVWEDEATRDAIRRRCKIVQFLATGEVTVKERMEPEKTNFNINEINF